MTDGMIASVVAATVLLIGIVLWRHRVRQVRSTGQAEASGTPDGREPVAAPVSETVPVSRPARRETAAPPQDARDPGADVLAHLRRLEARASPGLAAEVIPIFLQDTSARLTALREAIARQDGDAAYRVAHTLHGSATMVGAASLERGCAEIIRQVRSGSFDLCEPIVAELDADFELIRRAATA